jgi:precorrin-2 dehydrogenase/sirohydrochlorin ferrochelatase
MNYYPAFLDLRGRSCLLVGGGAVAARKIAALIDAGAVVTVVSPSLDPSLDELLRSGRIAHRQKRFDESDLAGMVLAIAATDDPAVNEAVAAACRQRGILVNTATSPEAGTFIVPSLVARGDLLIAVSTCGSSPALSRKVREELERSYGPEYGALLERLSVLRQRLLREVPDEAARREAFRAVVDSDVLGMLREGAVDRADRRIGEIVKSVTGR